MKRQYGKIKQRLAALMLGVLLTLGTVAQAADNRGFGDVNGDTNALLDSNIFQLFSSGQLTLVKTAWFTATGLPVLDGANLPAGTQVDFLIYVDNQSDLIISDVTIRDTLDALFSYGPANNIRVDNSVVECVGDPCTGVEEQAIYDSAIAAAATTDLPDGLDSVSYVAPVVNVGDQNEAGNNQQDAAANSVLAVVFTVTIT